MMDRDQLKREYGNLVLEGKAQIEQFKARCLLFLESKTMTDCFRLLPLIDIQKDFLKNNEDTEFHHLIKLFQIFEKYAASILVKPWCKDLHTIKVYTGFFKYNIEQWLSSDILYKVFKLIGYKKTSIDTLTLETLDYENRVLGMAFELFLAHTQLYFLKSAEDLSPKYSMENVLEGWLNTYGSVARILDWLVRNSSTITEKSEFERSTSGTDVPRETMRSKSVTIEGKPLYYDENGYTMVTHSVKYPPDHSASSSFTSLRASDVSDCQLYGDGDHTEPPPPPNSGCRSDSFDEGAMITVPLSFTNKLHVETQNRDFNQKVNLEMRMSALYPEDVVSRGGNSIRENSHIYGNIATGDTHIQAEKESFGQLLATRIAKGEETLQNRDSASKKFEGFCTTSLGGSKEKKKYKNDSEHCSTEHRQPSCHHCGGLSSYICEVCGKSFCLECFKTTRKQGCCGNKYTFFSNV